MNKVIIKGRLTRDPEVRYTQTTNTQIANISVAVNRRFVKEGEEREADFFNCIAFGKQAEFLSKYFKKGQEILLSGRLQTRNWDDDQGQKHYVTEIIIEEVEFCGSKSEKEEEKNVNAVEMNIIENNSPSDDLPF